MATIAQSPPAPPRPLVWFSEFLRGELTPYPGRLALVGRMTLAATIVMLICMTFGLSDGYLGAVFALFISRENPRTTLQAAGTMIFIASLAAAYMVTTVWFVISVPLLHFLWIVGSLFLAFYAIRVINNYGGAVIFGVMLSVGIPLFDRHLPAETNVEDTLRVTLATVIGAVVTTIIELVSARMPGGDTIVLAVDERLAAVEELLAGYLGEREQPKAQATEKKIIRLGVLGTSRLRRALVHAGYSPQYRGEMRAVVGLAGRLIDLAAVLTQDSIDFSKVDQMRLQNLVTNIATIRTDLVNGRIPAPIELKGRIPATIEFEDTSPHNVPLRQMEYIASLIPEAFVSPPPTDESVPLPDTTLGSKLFAPDALTNPAHLKFALEGCIAASSCYVVYMAIAWPGLSTSIQTCILTALSSIGVSRQKQVLRFAGAIVGGFGFSLGAQVFILPYVDSIGGFTVLFAVVTAVSAWFLTCSPRLSYFGLQVAFAFYLINLQEFAFQTSLSIARDRVVGVLLGLLMMGLVFDRLQGTPAAEMLRTFVSNVRLLAQLAREQLSKDSRTAAERADSLHETINSQFDQVTVLADSVLLEFGPSREHDLALANQIRMLQSQLRMIFVKQFVSLQYGLQRGGVDIPEEVRSAHDEFNKRLARALNLIADRVEGRPPVGGEDFGDSVERLRQATRAFCSGSSEQLLTAPCEAILSLSQKVESLTLSIEKELGLPS
jgi:multidrug resistance protein MdtO